MKLLFSLFLALVLTAGSTGEDRLTLLDSFIGAWHSDAPAFGAPASSAMTWQNAGLGDKFIKLSYKINTNPAGEPGIGFEGVAYYKTAISPEFEGFWADNSGNLHPIKAHIDGDSLVALWGTPETEQGKTQYHLVAPDKLEVTDWVKTPKGWRQFNQNIFQRLGNSR